MGCGGSCDDPGVRLCVRTNDANGVAVRPDKLTVSYRGAERETLTPTDRCESCCFSGNDFDGMVVSAEWKGETTSQNVPDGEAPGCGRESPVPVNAQLTFPVSE
jgi:hypothetical protein